jgi:short subunit dehydrogenase-like uncharacterized protein
MTNNVLIYGATGYTGRMISARAKSFGLPLILGGRDQESLAKLAAELDAPYIAFDLDDDAGAGAALVSAGLLLNCAGPYRRTANPLMRTALDAGTHYLDIAAELDSYLLAEQLGIEAEKAGVMLLPGSGGSVAMLGCLCGQAVARVAKPRAVYVALHVSGSMSRGSAISAAEGISTQILKRDDGALVERSRNELRSFDFGKGAVPCTPVTLPDLITIGKSTGVPDVETFVHVDGSAFPVGNLSNLPNGPNEEEREANPYSAAVEVFDTHGKKIEGTLHTVNGYTFTALAAAEAVRRVLSGEVKPGFQTPAGLFGDGFAETIANTRIAIRECD